MSIPAEPSRSVIVAHRVVATSFRLIFFSLGMFLMIPPIDSRPDMPYANGLSLGFVIGAASVFLAEGINVKRFGFDVISGFLMVPPYCLSFYLIREVAFRY
jgi:hypothetical protein